MQKKRTNSSPRRTAESTENKLINLAMQVAEQKLLDGTASSQIICHFLDLATTKEQLANEKLQSELEVNRAKLKQYEEANTQAELYAQALNAMKLYSGHSLDDESSEE